jgi:tetraacyldisaccharide 4'-kinase
MVGPKNIQRPLLLPLTPIYRLAVAIRNLLFNLNVIRSESFRIPVISVGNITVGGTGKTPHVEMLIRYLSEEYSPAVLSRGYKRKTNDFRLVSKKSPVSEVGDEPLQIKTHFPGIPVAVDANRVRGIRKLLKLKHRPNVIILDDAFQHRYVRPGLSILLVDYKRPVFNDIMLPAGNLREPWKNCRRAHILIVTKCPSNLSQSEKARFAEKLKPTVHHRVYFTGLAYGKPVPVFGDEHDTMGYKHLKKSGAGLMLVTGIANPAPLIDFLQEILTVHDMLLFPDHHVFCQEDVNVLHERFRSLPGSEKYILVTAKDAVKLRE